MNNQKNKTASSRNEVVKFIEEELKKCDEEIQETREWLSSDAFENSTANDDDQEEFLAHKRKHVTALRKESGFFFYLTFGGLQMAIVFPDNISAYLIGKTIEDRLYFSKLSETHFLYDITNGDEIERYFDSQGEITLIFRDQKLMTTLFEPYNSDELAPYVFYHEYKNGKEVFSSTNQIQPNLQRLNLLTKKAKINYNEAKLLIELPQLIQNKVQGNHEFSTHSINDFLKVELRISDKDECEIVQFEIFKLDDNKRIIKHEVFII